MRRRSESYSKLLRGLRFPGNHKGIQAWIGTVEGGVPLKPVARSIIEPAPSFEWYLPGYAQMRMKLIESGVTQQIDRMLEFILDQFLRLRQVPHQSPKGLARMPTSGFQMTNGTSVIH